MLFIEILTIFWQGFCQTLFGIFDAVYAMLPAAVQLNKLASYFTPTGMMALYLGVPTVLVTIICGIAKRVINKAKAR
ncbi:hypothetical protein [Pumilibacter intestinalis]|uniref:hypothetical protein n=1 Tax=Pumilibacter intestinalis TaxID=2941511 RepID=UPI0020403730|nr:hypothetical protein [Pumilibacter intestinalis]MCX4363125.1 hypothetical protein [Clostridia bacterium]